MKIFTSKELLKKSISNVVNLAFVPTLGGLHNGHISLIRIAKRRSKKVLVSIYVNPKQFNSSKDFKSYPRNLKTDIGILKKLKVDFLFTPNDGDIFAFKPDKKIYLHNFSKKLCGKFRTGHFRGVVNVINRFLDIIKPKYLILGKKDFQQFFLIKKHIEKNRIQTKIVSCDTVREKSGIACSSRNKNLKSYQLKKYIKIIRYVKKKKLTLNKNKIIKEIYNLGVKKIDYVEFLNLKTLKKPTNRKVKSNIFIAFYLGKTRLIDNF